MIALLIFLIVVAALAVSLSLLRPYLAVQPSLTTLNTRRNTRANGGTGRRFRCDDSDLEDDDGGIDAKWLEACRVRSKPPAEGLRGVLKIRNEHLVQSAILSERSSPTSSSTSSSGGGVTVARKTVRMAEPYLADLEQMRQVRAASPNGGIGGYRRTSDIYKKSTMCVESNTTIEVGDKGPGRGKEIESEAAQSTNGDGTSSLSLNKKPPAAALASKKLGAISLSSSPRNESPIRPRSNSASRSNASTSLLTRSSSPSFIVGRSNSPANRIRRKASGIRSNTDNSTPSSNLAATKWTTVTRTRHHLQPRGSSSAEGEDDITGGEQDSEESVGGDYEDVDSEEEDESHGESTPTGMVGLIGVQSILELEDTIKVEPRDFGRDPAEAIKDEIHRRYANKVLPGVGLCIALLEIVEASEGAVLYGDGCFYYKTVFKLIVFRPFVGEAFLAKVTSSSEAGVAVTVGFFSDILVPPSLLPDFCAFDPIRQLFFYTTPDLVLPEGQLIPTVDDLMNATPEDERMYIENKEWIKVRVAEEKFDDTSENVGKVVVKAFGAPVEPEIPDAVSNLSAPYSILASMNESGLGCLDWWLDPEEE